MEQDVDAVADEQEDGGPLFDAEAEVRAGEARDPLFEIREGSRPAGVDAGGRLVVLDRRPVL